MHLDAAVDDLAELLLADLVSDRLAIFVKVEADFEIELMPLDRAVDKTKVLQ